MSDCSDCLGDIAWIIAAIAALILGMAAMTSSLTELYFIHIKA